MVKTGIIIFLSACVVALGIFAGVSLGHKAGTSTRAASRQIGGLVSVVLPIQACSVRVPGTGSPTGHVATEMPVLIPNTLASSLSLYDASRLNPILAPRGWKCSASVGEDGSGNVTVYPPSTTAKEASSFVNAFTNGACSGCAASGACTYFANAASQIPDPGQQVCPSVPRSTWVTHLSGPTNTVETVELAIPPYGAFPLDFGSGSPTPQWQWGVINYVKGSNEFNTPNQLNGESCALSSLAICSSSLKFFLESDWGIRPDTISPTFVPTLTPLPGT
jgi:hypothetical protein